MNIPGSPRHSLVSCCTWLRLFGKEMTHDYMNIGKTDGKSKNLCNTVKPGFSERLHTAKSEKKAPLLNKPYENEVTLRRQTPPLKCCYPLDF